MPDECEKCHRTLTSADTYKKTIAPLKRMVEERVKVLMCKDHPDVRVMLQNAAEAPLAPFKLADLDVVVLIGLLRWRLGMKCSEIREFLLSKGIDLSEETI